MSGVSERRSSERFPVSDVVSCPFLSPVLEDFGPVRIKDISATGLSLFVPQALEAGMLLALTLANPARSFRRTVLARVTHCAPAQSSFLVGGIFETPLRYEEWTALVL